MSDNFPTAQNLGEARETLEPPPCCDATVYIRATSTSVGKVTGWNAKNVTSPESTTAHIRVELDGQCCERRTTS